MQCKLRFPLLQHMISISWYTQHVPRPGPSPPRRFWPLPRPAPHCGEGGVPRPAPSRRFFALPLPAPPRPVKKIASPPIPAMGCQNCVKISKSLKEKRWWRWRRRCYCRDRCEPKERHWRIQRHRNKYLWQDWWRHIGKDLHVIWKMIEHKKANWVVIFTFKYFLNRSMIFSF